MCSRFLRQTLVGVSVFAVAFLSAFVAYKLIHSPTPHLAASPVPAPENFPPLIAFLPSEPVPAKASSIQCADPRSAELLKMMLKNPEVRTELQKDIDAGSFDCSQALRRRDVDLNDDGKNEYIVALWVNMMCGSKGNCPAAVFTDTGNGLRQIYYHPAMQYLEVLNSRSKGYFDLDAEFSSGVYGRYIERTKFDGKTYRRTKCRNLYGDLSTEQVECWDPE